MSKFLMTIILIVPLFGMKPSVHYQLAYKAAISAGFSSNAAKIIAAGATAPDKYDWETAAAHGQTPNDTNGYPTMEVEEATAAFDRYTQEKSAQIDAALSAGNSAGGLYLIGYTMHAFQDLSAHMGMTNYTHSQLASEGRDPDVDPDRVVRAATWSSDFLDRSAVRWNAPWNELKQFQGRGPSDFDELSAAISSGEADRTWASLISYWSSRFSNNRPPSGSWGGISEVQTILTAALNRISPSSSAASLREPPLAASDSMKLLYKTARECWEQTLPFWKKELQNAESSCTGGQPDYRANYCRAISGYRESVASTIKKCSDLSRQYVQELSKVNGR